MIFRGKIFPVGNSFHEECSFIQHTLCSNFVFADTDAANGVCSESMERVIDMSMSFMPFLGLAFIFRAS